ILKNYDCIAYHARKQQKQGIPPETRTLHRAQRPGCMCGRSGAAARRDGNRGWKILTLTIPILDNHMHLNPSGRCLDAVREFARAGGTHIVLVSLPPCRWALILNYPEITGKYSIKSSKSPGAHKKLRK